MLAGMRDFLNNILALARGRILPSSAPVSRPARMTSEHAQNVTNLRARPCYLGVSKVDFAELCDVHPNTVSNWARGRTRMSGAAELVLMLLEDHHEVRRALCVGVKAKGEPRGRAFKPGNPYRFGDRRRRVAVAGGQMARAAA
jgi:DNA-binding transcriptional regulator YiaG